MKFRILLILIIILSTIGLITLLILYFSDANTAPKYSTISSVKNIIQITPQPTITLDINANDWVFTTNECFTYKYPSTWAIREEDIKHYSQNSGIKWIKIFSDKTNGKDLAKFTYTAIGTEFNLRNYKRQFFPISYPRMINGMKVYNSDQKYLIETNCKDNYLLIDIFDATIKDTIEDIVLQIQ